MSSFFSLPRSLNQTFLSFSPPFSLAPGEKIVDDPPVSLSMFQEVVERVCPNVFRGPIALPHLYRCFDMNGDGRLTVKEALTGLILFDII